MLECCSKHYREFLGTYADLSKQADRADLFRKQRGAQSCSSAIALVA
jgi:hypothetical protein